MSQITRSYGNIPYMNWASRNFKIIFVVSRKLPDGRKKKKLSVFCCIGILFFGILLLSVNCESKFCEIGKICVGIMWNNQPSLFFGTALIIFNYYPLVELLGAGTGRIFIISLKILNIFLKNILYKIHPQKSRDKILDEFDKNRVWNFQFFLFTKIKL
jgi:hypothetical protein